MKINGYQASRLYEAYANKNGSAVNNSQEGKPVGKEKPDRVEISSTASDMNDAVSLGQKVTETETPEERQSRIDQIKQMIDEGTYNVSSRAVAASILLGGNLDVKA